MSKPKFHIFSFGGPTNGAAALALVPAVIVVFGLVGFALTFLGVPCWTLPLVAVAYAVGRLGR